MTWHDLDPVVLTRDLPDHGLRHCDLGTIVHVYPRGGLEIEFTTAAGDTVAVVTLPAADVRPPQRGTRPEAPQRDRGAAPGAPRRPSGERWRAVAPPVPGLAPLQSAASGGRKDWQAHVTVSPPPLALSERKLAEDLRDFWGTKRDNSKYRDTEVCLLRNLPKVGVGMFVRSGFYPDFILWVRNLKTKATRVVFLDPHGLHHEGIQGNDRFEAIEKLRALGESGRFKAKNIGLDGYILAPAQTTPDRIPGAKGMSWAVLEAKFPLLRQDGAYIERIVGNA
ncbi:MAG: DUF4926 domain-containing protein [Chloroflexi bacterium]|nr:DUF4926 domain-containing protein [Chloroflexota bacterium]